MARINIDDTLYGDPRFEMVVRKIGIDLAVGQFVRIAKLAQKFWLDGERPIPENIYDYGEFSKHFVETEFVQRVEGGLYLHGTERQFAWIASKSKNGKKGGRPNKNNNITKATGDLGKATESYGNPLTLTLTPTLTQKKKKTTKKTKVCLFSDDYLGTLNMSEKKQKELLEKYDKDYLEGLFDKILEWRFTKNKSNEVTAGQVNAFLSREKPQLSEKQISIKDGDKNLILNFEADWSKENKLNISEI